MSEETLRRQLYESFENRAILYYLIFDELRTELGAEKAEAILKRAIYRRGVQKGSKYAPYAPADFGGLKDAFISAIPDEGRMFSPELVRCDAEGLDIKFHSCPLKDAWQSIGVGGEELAAICRIAASIDNGTFESAGFRFWADTWRPGSEGCCFLHVRPPQ